MLSSQHNETKICFKLNSNGINRLGMVIIANAEKSNGSSYM